LFMYPGKTVSGGTCTQANRSGCDGFNSRLYAAKNAITKAVSAYGTIDFGLMTFDLQLCQFNATLCWACGLYNCGAGCNPCSTNCNASACLYANNGFSTFTSINWIPQSCTGPGSGGRILTMPAPTSAAPVLAWLDGVEDHRSSGDGNNAYGTGST